MGCTRVGTWMAGAIMGLGLVCFGASAGDHGGDRGEGHQEHSGRSREVYVGVDRQPVFVVAREAPPAVIVEERVVSPGEGYTYVNGYWHWDSTRYVWVSGQWIQPPHAEAVWVAPRYERSDDGFHFTVGFWRR